MNADKPGCRAGEGAGEKVETLWMRKNTVYEGRGRYSGKYWKKAQDMASGIKIWQLR